MAKMDDDLCTPYDAVDVRLTGGFACALNNSERNEWTEYANGTPECEALVSATARLRALEVLAMGGSDVSLYQLQTAHKEREAALMNIYRVASTWFDGLVARRKVDREEGVKRLSSGS